MNTKMSDLDAAWQQVVGARARHDENAEARALTLLAQALHLEGRSKEAFAIGEEVIDRAWHCPFQRDIQMKLSEGLREEAFATRAEAIDCAHLAEAKARRDLATARGVFAAAADGLGRGAEATDWRQERRDCARRCHVERDVLMQLYEILMQWGTRQEEAARREEADHSIDAYLDWPDHGSDPALFRSAHVAYDQALDALNALADAPEPLKEEVRKRASAVTPPPEPGHMLVPEAVAATVIAGFLAVKALGPFLEAWATKLGELAGESTARMLGRIHMTKIRHRGRGGSELPEDRTELVAALPNGYLMIILPRHLSDAAKLALIDLNPAGLTDRTTRALYWCANAGAWLPQQKRAARGCPTCQHPECSLA
jgi:hypothetical protein